MKIRETAEDCLEYMEQRKQRKVGLQSNHSYFKALALILDCVAMIFEIQWKVD